jgi:Xaa-Pro aminopeptidase
LFIASDGTGTIFSTTPVSTPLVGRLEVVEKLGRRDAFALALDYLGNRRMTLGYDTLSFENYQQLIKTAPSTSLVSVKELLYELRQVKSPEELELLRRGAEIASTALDVAREVITLGTTSSDIRRAIADNVYRSGAELVSNPHIAIGEDTFLHTSSHPNRSIKKGDPVMIRVGVRVGGYTAVLSRTLYYGDNPPDKFVKDYNSLMQLKETIRTAVSPWSSAVSIYDRCRAAALELRLEPSTLTIFGRGVGVEAEEPPILTSGSSDIIRENTVISIGPDLLLCGRYGISDTDMYHVTSSGTKPLTDAEHVLALY